MFTREQFDSLEVGDLVETEALFPGLSGELILLHTEEAEPGSNIRVFVASYMGITLGRWTCIFKGKTIEWQM